MQHCQCKITNHKDMKGLCLNEDCDYPLFCITCEYKHLLHQHDCLSFQQAQQSIYSYQSIFQEFNHHLQYLNGNTERLQQTFFPYLTYEIEKLIELQKLQQTSSNVDEIVFPFRTKMQFAAKLSKQILGDDLFNQEIFQNYSMNYRQPFKCKPQKFRIFSILKRAINHVKVDITIEKIKIVKKENIKGRLQSNQTDKAFSLYNQNSHFVAFQEGGNSIQSVKTIYSVSSTQLNYQNASSPQQTEQLCSKQISSQVYNEEKPQFNQFYAKEEINKLDSLNVCPKNPEIEIQKAQTLINQGRQEEAVQILLQACNIDLQNSNFHVCLKIGKILMNMNCFNEAFQCFDLARIFEMENSNIYLECGKALINSSQNRLAIQYLQESLNLDKKNREAWAYRGQALCNLDLHLEATISFENAIQLGQTPKHLLTFYGSLFSYFLIAKSLSHQNRLEEAVMCYNDIIETDPKNIQALQNKGLALLQLNLHFEAFQCFDAILSIDPQNQEAFCNKGKCLEQPKKINESAILFQIVNNPNQYNLLPNNQISLFQQTLNDKVPRGTSFIKNK